MTPLLTRLRGRGTAAEGGGGGGAGRRLASRLLITGTALAALYLALCVAAYVLQRELIYHPTTARAAPAAGFQALELSSEQERIVAWWRPPPSPDAGVVLYLHGNGGNLAGRADRLRDLATAGFGVLAIDYRGYGGSSGEPTEAGLRRDALAAYDFARAQAPASRIAVIGESLGSGVATRLATERPVAGLLYDSPFASMVRMTRLRAPVLPGGLLLIDRYESEARIDEVAAPLLILHCDRDVAIPIAEGRRLFAAARQPKRFVTVTGCGHVATWRADTRPLILETLAAWTRRTSPTAPLPKQSWGSTREAGEGAARKRGTGLHVVADPARPFPSHPRERVEPCPTSRPTRKCRKCRKYTPFSGLHFGESGGSGAKFPRSTSAHPSCRIPEAHPAVRPPCSRRPAV